MRGGGDLRDVCALKQSYRVIRLLRQRQVNETACWEQRTVSRNREYRATRCRSGRSFLLMPSCRYRPRFRRARRLTARPKSDRRYRPNSNVLSLSVERWQILWLCLRINLHAYTGLYVLLLLLILYLFLTILVIWNSTEPIFSTFLGLAKLCQSEISFTIL